jgi:hypothetical protein
LVLHRSDRFGAAVGLLEGEVGVQKGYALWVVSMRV